MTVCNCILYCLLTTRLIQHIKKGSNISVQPSVLIQVQLALLFSFLMFELEVSTQGVKLPLSFSVSRYLCIVWFVGLSVTATCRKILPLVSIQYISRCMRCGVLQDSEQVCQGKATHQMESKIIHTSDLFPYPERITNHLKKVQQYKAFRSFEMIHDLRID